MKTPHRPTTKKTVGGPGGAHQGRPGAIGVAASRNPVAARIRQRMAHLSADLEEDEIAPSEAAQRACQSHLTELAARLSSGAGLSLPHISTSGQGDLSCEWRDREKVLVALFSPAGAMSLHAMELIDGRVDS